MLRFRGRMAGMEGEDKAGGGSVVHGEQSACKKAWTLAGEGPPLSRHVCNSVFSWIWGLNVCYYYDFL